MLKLWNTASRSLETFQPIKPPHVGMYTCGPTVYWTAHIGNLRTYVFEDVLLRTLELEGYTVKRVMNLTDVGHLTSDEDEGEDKMEIAAEREGKTATDIAEFYTKKFLEDARALNIRIPDSPLLCKATEHIPEQIELIQELERKGFTYQTSDGIYFDTSKFPTYGALSGQKLEEKAGGARVAMNEEKRNKTDFALWKFSATGTHRQQEWSSPWGVGFPGWHIECSAMAKKYLGQPFDIHCGGADHIAVHHENEIAQSEAAYGVKLANIWMHGEFLLVDNGKMSKSLGNVYTISDLIAKGFDPLALRLFFLGAHYRQKQNFTWEALQAAQNALKRLRSTVRGWKPPKTGIIEYEAEFTAALEDDLNTPKGLAVLWKLIDDQDHPTENRAATLEFMDRVLGLDVMKEVGRVIEIPEDIQTLAKMRDDARAERNWQESDRLRGELESLGWIVKDTKTGTELERP